MLSCVVAHILSREGGRPPLAETGCRDSTALAFLVAPEKEELNAVFSLDLANEPI